MSGSSIGSLDLFVLLSCCSAPPLKLIDLPGLDSRSSSDDSPVSKMLLQLSPFQDMIMGKRKFGILSCPRHLPIFPTSMLNTNSFDAHKVRIVHYCGY